MHQQNQQHAFTSTLHQLSPILPVSVVRAQDRNPNMRPPRQSSGADFAPISPGQRTTQRSSRPARPGRWAALHVCIAWRIYYHKQFKKMQEKSKTLGNLLPNWPSTSPLDSVQPKKSQLPSCKHPGLDSPCGVSAYENIDDSCETGKTAANMSQSSLFYLHPSSPTNDRSCVTRLEGGPQPTELLWEEKTDKEEHKSSQTDTRKHLPFRGISWDPKMIPELNGRSRGSLDRKRLPESENLIKVKRVKKETEDSRSGFSPTLHSDSSSVTPHVHPYFHAVQVQRISSLCALYPNGGTCIISYPSTELHPYQAQSWGSTWNNRGEFHLGPNVLKNYFMDTFNGFFTAPLYFSPSPEQETLYLRGREILSLL